MLCIVVELAVSRVTCHMSPIACNMSPVNHSMQLPLILEPRMEGDAGDWCSKNKNVIFSSFHFFGSFILGNLGWTSLTRTLHPLFRNYKGLTDRQPSLSQKRQLIDWMRPGADAVKIRCHASCVNRAIVVQKWCKDTLCQKMNLLVFENNPAVHSGRVSSVTCHMSHDTCFLSHVTWSLLYVASTAMKAQDVRWCSWVRFCDWYSNDIYIFVFLHQKAFVGQFYLGGFREDLFD